MTNDTLGQIDHLSFQIDGNNESNRTRETDGDRLFRNTIKYNKIRNTVKQKWENSLTWINSRAAALLK